MARYFSQRRVRSDDAEYYADDWAAQCIPTVSDHEATDTGLIDADGFSIMRAPNPIGFGKDEDW